MGATNCVAYLFERKGLFVVPAEKADEETLMHLALEAGAEDIKREGDKFEIVCEPDVYAEVNDALAKSEIDAVVVHAGSLQTLFLDDTTAPFRPNPLFKSWVPLTEHPECFVVYRPGEQPVLVYFQPRDYWHQPPADPDGSNFN